MFGVFRLRSGRDSPTPSPPFFPPSYSFATAAYDAPCGTPKEILFLSTALLQLPRPPALPLSPSDLSFRFDSRVLSLGGIPSGPRIFRRLELTNGATVSVAVMSSRACLRGFWKIEPPLADTSRYSGGFAFAMPPRLIICFRHAECLLN